MSVTLRRGEAGVLVFFCALHTGPRTQYGTVLNRLKQKYTTSNRLLPETWAEFDYKVVTYVSFELKAALIHYFKVAPDQWTMCYVKWEALEAFSSLLSV